MRQWFCEHLRSFFKRPQGLFGALDICDKQVQSIPAAFFKRPGFLTDIRNGIARSDELRESDANAFKTRADRVARLFQIARVSLILQHKAREVLADAQPLARAVEVRVENP